MPLIKHESEFILNASPKTYTLDQDKSLDPKDTAENAVRMLSKMYDLSHVRLEQREGEVSGAYSFSGISDQLNASGKGLTIDQARASAVMEFAERYSWTHFNYLGADGYKFAAYDEISKGPVKTVNKEYFFSNYINLNSKEELLSLLIKTPLRFIKGYSLASKQKYYYPLNWHNMVQSSNGLASGNTKEEAILQALCEVIERENIYKYFVEEKPARDVEGASISNPLIRKVIDSASLMGITFIIKDISFTAGLPTFIVYGTSAKDAGKITHKGAGQGAAINPEKALIRAFSEYFESYSMLKKSEKDSAAKNGPDASKYLSYLPKRHYGFHVLYNPEMLYRQEEAINLSQIADLSKNDFKDEIEMLANKLSSLSYEVIVIDKTNRNLQIPAVRVFVPGMRNMVNCDILSPAFPLFEVNYEAKKDDEALSYYQAMLKNLFGATASMYKMKTEMKLDKIYSRDYLENLKSFHKIKKSALDTLREAEMAMEIVKKRMDELE